MLITCGKLILGEKLFPPFIFLKPCASMFLLCQEHTNQKNEKELNLLDLGVKAQELFKRVEERAERSLLLFNLSLCLEITGLLRKKLKKCFQKGEDLISLFFLFLGSQTLKKQQNLPLWSQKNNINRQF